MKASSQSGFTLVEAIVALVILTTTMAGVFSLVNTDLISLRRAESVIVSQSVVREAVRRIQLESLRQKDRGVLKVGEHRVEWSAKLVESETYGRNQRGGVGFYDLGLYQVELKVRQDSAAEVRWHTRLTQYRKTRGQTLD